MSHQMIDFIAQVRTVWQGVTGQELLCWTDRDVNGAPDELIQIIQQLPDPIATITWENQAWVVARAGQPPEQYYLASLHSGLSDANLLGLAAAILDKLDVERQITQQLSSELETSWSRLNFLYELAQITFQIDEPDQLFYHLAQSLRQVIEAEDICLVFKEDEQPRLYTASGRYPPGLEKLAMFTNSAAPLIILRADDTAPRALLNAIPNLRSLLIVPMPLTGELRGLVALVNHPGDVLRPADQQLLTSAVELIGMLINTQLARHAQEANRRLDLELSVASQIQASFLPTILPDIPELEFAASLLPAHQISGDFYDVQGVNNHWAIMVGDVAGKGIPAAMLAAMIHATLKSEVNHHTQPAQLLRSINQLIYAELDRSDTFITAFLAVLQTQPLQLSYASAGHTTTLLWRSAEQQVLQLSSTGLPLGIFPDTEYTEHQLPLNLNDVLVLYSDGITEAENDQGRVFGSQALIDLLLAGHPAPIDQQLQLIFNGLDLHRGKLPLRDDVVLFMVRARGPESAIQVQPFVFTAEKRNVRTLATQVRQITSTMPFTSPAERSAFLNDLELAVSEIATNIVIHAYHDSPYTGRIQGRVTLFPERVQVDLIDSGTAFESPVGLSLLQRQPVYSPIDPPTSGYGLAIARRLLDVCEYTRLPNGRNHWRLEKFIAQETHPNQPASTPEIFR